MATIFGQTQSPFRTAAYQYIRESDNLPTIEDTPPWPLCKIKLFNPTGAGTWYIAGVDRDTGQCFGLAEIQEREIGYFDINELIALRPRFGLPIERDLHWTPTPMKELMDD